MARTARNQKLDTRSARAKLSLKKSGYWVPLAQGCSVGYRKGAKGGMWVAKLVRIGFRREITIGPADDLMDADGVTALSFAEAQEKARDWFRRAGREAAGEMPTASYTVHDAIADYLTDYKAGHTRGGGKGVGSTLAAIVAHILPKLGKREVATLTGQDIHRWLEDLANTPARLRSRQGAKPRYRERASDPESVRQRRATANRILSILKAALNHAFHQRRVTSRHAWEAVRPYRETNAPKVRWLTDAEAVRLVNAAPTDLRALVTAALLTGARYGELAALRVQDYSPDQRSVFISRSKSGKTRHVALTDEGARFFDTETTGKAASNLILTRASGALWNKSHQFRPLREACVAARIEPAISFHVLRHTYASRLAMRAVPMGVIAAQLGHTDTRMTERHYAHLAPSYVADTVRAAFGTLNIVPPTNLVPLSS